MDRRTFIIAGTSGLAAVTAAWVYLGNTPDNFPTTLGLIWEPDAIIEIGKKYRAAFPEEDDKGKLVSLLEPVMGVEVESRVKEDFVAGHIVHVDGWIISLTEARQCALTSLSS